MNHIKKQDGFTLIEVIVVLCILSVVILPVSSMFTVSARNNAKSSIEFEASSIAQRYMEETKSSNKEKKYDEKISDGKFDISVGLSPVGEEKFKNKVYVDDVVKYDLTIDYLNNKIYIDDMLFSADKEQIKITFDDEICSVDDVMVLSLKGISDPTIKINADNKIIMDIINERNDKVKIYTNGDCLLNVLKGNVEKNANIKDDNIERKSEYILYKVQIGVYYKNELITLMEGYKVYK